MILAIPQSWREVFEPYIMGSAQILFLLLPIIIISGQVPIPKKEIFRIKNKPNIGILLLSLLGIFFFQFILNGYIVFQDLLIPESMQSWYMDLREFIQDKYSGMLGGDTWMEAFRAIVIAAIIPGICEEFLFRGFAQRLMEQKLNYHKAIIYTAIIFSLIHLNPIDMIPLFLIGLLLGYTVFISGSIYPAVLMHMANNLMAVLILYNPQGKEIDTAVKGISPITGLFFIIAGLAATYIYFVLLAKLSRKLREGKPQAES